MLYTKLSYNILECSRFILETLGGYRILCSKMFQIKKECCLVETVLECFIMGYKIAVGPRLF